MKDADGAASSIVEGEVLGGKYRVDSALGRGGMGAVFAATELGHGARVAIKVLLSHTEDDPVHRARFQREARAVKQLTSPHVARVLDVGTSASGAPFIVMELLEGEDLEQVAGRRGPMPAPEVVDIAMQACAALAEAHALGIVHRDVKPRNLFMTRHLDGRRHVKVLDFGISKWLEADDQTVLTRTSEVLGSPHYMSPEQLSTPRAVDARTDVWALGAAMYRMLAGRRPFEAETLPHVCARVLNSSPEPLPRVRLDLPPALVAVVARCLEKQPSARYGSVLALADALRPFLALDPGVVLAPVVTPPPPRGIERVRDQTVTASAPLLRGRANEALDDRTEASPPPEMPRPAPSPRRAPSVRALAVLLGVGGALALGAAAIVHPGATRPGAATAPDATTGPPGDDTASAAPLEPAPPIATAAGPDALPSATSSAKRARRAKPIAAPPPPPPAPPPAPSAQPTATGPPDVRH